MSVTPTGVYSLPLYYLREGLANSAAFRTAVGAADAAAARALVFYVAAPGETAASYAVVDHGATWGAEEHAGGSRNEFVVDGEVWLTLILAVNAALSESDQDLTAYNTIGAVVKEILDDAGAADRLNVTGLRISPPMRPEEKLKAQIGDFIQVDVTLTYRSFA